MAWCLIKHRDNFTFTFTYNINILPIQISEDWPLNKLSSINGKGKVAPMFF